MRIHQTFDTEFDKLYNNYCRKYPELMKCEGIDRSQLDVGVMSKRYFTEDITDVTIDTNANANEDRCPNSYIAEITKGMMKLEGYYLLWHYAQKRFSLERANELIEAIWRGDVYFHDASGSGIQMPYCYAFSTNMIMQEGRPYGQLHSLRPKRADSFLAQCTETTMDLSQEFAGAIAPSDMIVNYAWYAQREQLTDFDVKNDFQKFVHVVNNKFRVGNQCVDEHTEVLTPSGFVNYNDLHIGDDIYVWNNGNLEVQIVNMVNISYYTGEMHEYSGRDIIQTVTPNHKVLHMKNNHRLYEDKYILSTSDEIVDMKSPLQIPVATISYTKNEYNISDSEIQLAAIILCDGSIDVDRINIFKSFNRNGNDLIVECLEDLEIPYLHDIVTNADGFGIPEYITEVNRYRFNKTKCTDRIKNINKNIIPDWVFQLSRRQANIFIETWSQFDGHTREYNCKKLQVDSYELANQLQHVCVLAGYGSRITERIIGNNKKSTIYVIPYVRSVKSCKHVSKISYSGIVWCPSTDAGVVIYRKDNKVFISGNSPFVNISLFDRPKLESIFEHYLDLDIEYIIKIQEIIGNWFSEGDPNTGLPYRFPIMTLNISRDENNNIIDRKFLDWVSNVNLKTGCFNMYANPGNKIASCCRLINDSDRMPFRADTFGNGGLSLGSHRVVTINLPRIAMCSPMLKAFEHNLQNVCDIARDLLLVHRYEILQRRIDQGFLKFFNPLKWFSLDHLFSTIGIIGVYEMNKFMGIDIQSKEGIEFTKMVLKEIEATAIEYSKENKCSFNVEEIPGESVAIKFCQKDNIMFGENKFGFKMYSNQYIPLIENALIPERIQITGQFQDILSGGGILHINMQDKLEDPADMKHLIEYTIEHGVSHFAVNYGFGKCENGHTTVCGNSNTCAICGASITDHYTRIVGYFTHVDSWNPTRREFEFPRRVFGELQ